MPTTSFTTRLDSDIKQEIEQIAKFEDRSASYIASQALRAYVEERQATRDLVECGLKLVEKGAPGIAPHAVHEWFLAAPGAPFPKRLAYNSFRAGVF